MIDLLKLIWRLLVDFFDAALAMATRLLVLAPGCTCGRPLTYKNLWRIGPVFWPQKNAKEWHYKDQITCPKCKATIEVKGWVKVTFVPLLLVASTLGYLLDADAGWFVALLVYFLVLWPFTVSSNQLLITRHE